MPIRQLIRLLALVVASSACAVAAAPSLAGGDPGARPGRYVGTTQGKTGLTFQVTRDGRSVRHFDTAVVAYCTGVAGPSGPNVFPVAKSKFALSKSGRLNVTYRTTVDGAKVKIHLRGNIDRGRLKNGKMTYSSAVENPALECVTDGPQPFKATRRR